MRVKLQHCKISEHGFRAYIVIKLLRKSRDAESERSVHRNKLHR